MAVVAGVRRDEFWDRDDASRPGQRSATTSRQRIEGLFDIELVVAPDGGLAAPDRPGTSLTAVELVELVRRTGGEGLDVRIVAPAGEQNLPTLVAMARLLDQDVLVPPPGAELQEIPASAYPGASGAGGGEIVAVDLATGYPLDWWTIPPSGQIGAVPGWFDLVGGLVLPRTGPVVLPLPGGGLMLATREDFVQRRTAAAALRPGHPGLVTVAVAIRSGAFVLGDYSGRSVLCDGPALAAALASLPLYGADLRLWLSWPESVQERHRLGQAVTEFAEVTGATVWVPVERGRIEHRDGCRDLSAVDADGEPTGWQPYGQTDRPQFVSDVDGRLVPLGGVTVHNYPGVALVSVQPAREQQMAARYAQASTPEGVFAADLAVLADGRLALRYADGSLLAAGGRQLGLLLRTAGWRGSPIVLLSPISPERAAGARQHAAELAKELGSPITFAELAGLDAASHAGASAVAVPAAGAAAGAGAGAVPGAGAAAGPPVTPDAAPAPVRVPMPFVAPLAPPPAPPPLPPPAPPVPVRVSASSRADLPVIAASAVRDPDPDSDPDPNGGLGPNSHLGPNSAPGRAGPRRGPSPSRYIDGPRLTQAGRSAPPHRITWLPAGAQTNSEAFEVYVECSVTPADALVNGVPSAYLFLLGYLDGHRLATRTAAEHLLRVRVEPGGAIDVSASEVAIPRALTEALSHSDVYLLPAAWLNRCQVIETVALPRADDPAARDPAPEQQPLLLRCHDAGHGVPGLPVEVVRWPHGSLRPAATRFALVAESPDGPREWLSLLEHKPQPTSGHRLLALRVDRGTAIDVRATAEDLAGLSSVRSGAAQLVAAGVEVLLPVPSFARASVLREYRYDPQGWQRVRSAGGIHLDTWTCPSEQR